MLLRLRSELLHYHKSWRIFHGLAYDPSFYNIMGPGELRTAENVIAFRSHLQCYSIVPFQMRWGVLAYLLGSVDSERFYHWPIIDGKEICMTAALCAVVPD